MTTLRVFVLLVASFCVCGQVAANPVTVKNSRFMRIHGPALPPYGFVRFCEEYAKECAAAAYVSNVRMNATPNRLSELDQVNRAVNTRIKPITDRELYGRDEHWTFPHTQGDCEDYVVLKRKMLMQRGWPTDALLITVVLDEFGEGHAVLTVRTIQGDFVLDNKVNDVRLWNQTPYHYLMRQSYLNPSIWMALDPRASSRQTAGLRTNGLTRSPAQSTNLH